MFENALKANLPIIGVNTDDPGGFPRCLQSIANGKPLYMESKLAKMAFKTSHLWWTDKEELVTRDLYLDCLKESIQVVVINPTAGNHLIFYAGIMPTPPDLMQELVEEQTNNVGEITACLKGMSLKAAREAMLLTEARTGALTPKELRKTRSMLTGGSPGLTLLNADVDFYAVPPQLAEWLKVNSKYFTTLVHPRLTPRGLLLDGSPGTGKSMAGRYIASQWGVPLYHLDLAGLLTKYVGTAEERLRHILGSLDKEEPCIVLIDEVEKVINTTEDAGVTKRLLSQLLWWLQEHESRVFTIMTTNKLDAIPPELYRPGRVDKIIRVPPLKKGEISAFAFKVAKAVGVKSASVEAGQIMAATMYDELGIFDGEASQAAVTGVVYDTIKKHGWVLTNKKDGVESVT